MKMKVVAAACLTLANLSSAIADEGVQLYGRVHQAIEKNTSTQVPGSSPIITDVNSRLGVRGSEDLGGGLNAIFSYEFGVDTDAVNNGATNMNTRHAYVGFKGKFGTLIVGSQDGGNDSQAPLYTQAVDAIGSVNNNGGALIVVGVPGSNTLDSPIERVQRVGNSVGYAGQFGDYSISARHSLQGTDNANRTRVSSIKENGIRLTEVTVNWKSGPLTLGVGAGYLDSEEALKPTPFMAFMAQKSTYQAVAAYDFGFVRVSGLAAQNRLYGKNPINGNDINRDYALSALVPITSNQGVLVNVTDSERNENFATEQLREYQVSYYYDFSKRTRAYTGLVFGKNETTAPAFSALGSRTDYERKFAAGLRHNF